MKETNAKKEYQNIKQNKAITLIALVITIIVLLILAGVSVSMLTGENGILTQAEETKKKNDKSEEKELIGLAIQSFKIEQKNNKLEIKKFKENLNNEIGENNYELLLTEKEIIVKIKKTGNLYSINEDGTVKEKENKNIIGIEDLSIGDYINYNIEYNNANSVQEEAKTWRVFSKSQEEGKEFVKIITTGVPLSMEIGSTTGEIKSILEYVYICSDLPESISNGEYIKEWYLKECEFVNGENNKIQYVSDLKELFRENEFTSKNEDGSPKVEILNKTMIEEILQMPIVESISVVENDLLAINHGTEYAKIIIPDISGNNERWCIEENGDFKLLQDAGEYGIRPVVSLKSNVKFIESDKKINGNVTYDLMIEHSEDVLPEYYVKFAEYENYSVYRNEKNTLNIITTQNIEKIELYNKAGRKETNVEISYTDKDGFREWKVLHRMSSVGTQSFSLECYNKEEEKVQTITRLMVRVKRVV